MTERGCTDDPMTTAQTSIQTKNMNTTALAYIGDAVYEIYVRERVLQKEHTHVDRLHKLAIGYVNNEGQAKAVKRLLNDGFLTVEEVALVKRARNHKTSSKPRNADPVNYKLATAFEALIGWLHLEGRKDRMEEIIFRAMEIIERPQQKAGRPACVSPAAYKPAGQAEGDDQ